ncbi:MAG: sodium-dependent transporter [Clostridiales bacterium]|nr:sodium-dependent transporter [Clostridiales bacterium]MDU3239941.1 sodium-dependent transporter [Clostridiales bacterium]
MEKKGQWASSLGFILATAGAAVGLGNLWKFPYLMGKNGGFQFLITYLIFIAVLGLPVMITEMSIGRMTGKGPVQAYENLNPKSKIIGIMGILCAFIILSYYSVIGGWILKYIASYVTSMSAPVDFSAYIAEPAAPVIWHLVFMACTGFVCYRGTKGIEKASRFMMPGLLILLVIIVIRSLTLPGANQGVDFVFKMNGGFDLKSVPAALGQVFYSLSLCMGITITYGSYLNRKENIPKNALIVAGLDTFVAILAGLAIFPAVFAFGLEPAQGPSLTFGTLPKVFESMSGGWIFALLFFGLMFFAALTSAIALLECVVSSVLDHFKCKRRTAVIFVALGVFLLGIPSALSFGVLGDVTILNYSVFDFMGMLTDNILMPIGGILMCIFVGWIWGPKRILQHVESDGISFKLKKAWLICIRFITPILVVIVTVMGFMDVYRTIMK